MCSLSKTEQMYFVRLQSEVVRPVYLENYMYFVGVLFGQKMGILADLRPGLQVNPATTLYILMRHIHVRSLFFPIFLFTNQMVAQLTFLIPVFLRILNGIDRKEIFSYPFLGLLFRFRRVQD